jgi:GT2 family glycosyltransferase
MLSCTIIIPNVFRDQLEWFLRMNYQHLDKCQVIVVSSDPEVTQPLLDQYIDDARLIAISKPLGFAKTVNLGFAKATTSWMGTVNDDVELSKDWAADLISAAMTETAALNPVISQPDGSIESIGILYDPIGRAIPITALDHKRTAPFRMSACNAACVIYRRNALEQVGYFDERFGSYLEDIDLSLRLNLAGWQNTIVPTVRVIHYKHQTSSKILGRKKAWLDARNWWLIIFKFWVLSDWLERGPAMLLERARNLSGIIKAYLR